MKLQVSTAARRDLKGIGDYIARDSSERAKNFITDLQTQCQKLAQQPTLYPGREELGISMRSCAFGRYVIFFSVHKQADAILIHRILHSAMDIGKHLPAGSTPNMLSQDVASYL